MAGHFVQPFAIPWKCAPSRQIANNVFIRHFTGTLRAFDENSILYNGDHVPRNPPNVLGFLNAAPPKSTFTPRPSLPRDNPGHPSSSSSPTTERRVESRPWVPRSFPQNGPNSSTGASSRYPPREGQRFPTSNGPRPNAPFFRPPSSQYRPNTFRESGASTNLPGTPGAPSTTPHQSNAPHQYHNSFGRSHHRPRMDASGNKPTYSKKNQRALSQATLAKEAVRLAKVRIQGAEHRLATDLDATEEATQVIARPPVVTIMGHVDHGKTTLLDALRHSNVVATESGGITQHIGAFTVDITDFQKDSSPNASQFITFLDTPGHAAFTAMRARGTQVTDMVILVVAADDGLQPQTIEAIQHAQASDVPIIVAINKIDVPHKKVELLYDQLTRHGVHCEPIGGDTQVVSISALKRLNLDALLEAITVQAEMLELKADPQTKLCVGAILECKVVKGRGIVATLLVKQGTLSTGDVILAGNNTYSKVRKLINDHGKEVKLATPSVAVETDGWKSLPNIGDSFRRVSSEDVAKNYLSEWERERERIEGVKDDRVIDEKRRLDSIERSKVVAEKRNRKRNGNATPIVKEVTYEKEDDKSVEALNVILKTDVQGSIEAIKGLLTTLSEQHAEEGMPKPIHLLCTGVGCITETDIHLASTCDALVIGFHVGPSDKQVSALAKQNNITIRMHRIIYELVDEVKDLLVDRAAPLKVLPVVVSGTADILKIFKVTVKGQQCFVAGCRVADGVITRNANVRLLRNGEVIHESVLVTLKKNKDTTETATKGAECGIALDRNYGEFKVGDVIQCLKT